MNFNKVNVAIQLLPLNTTNLAETLQYVDHAIELIQKSGLKYQVCPFETVIEGDYDTIMQLVKNIQIHVFERGLKHLIVNMKIENSAIENLSFEAKTAKFEENK